MLKLCFKKSFKKFFFFLFTYHFHSPILFLENVNAASTNKSPEILRRSQKLVSSLTVTTPQTEIIEETLNRDLTKSPFVIINKRDIVIFVFWHADVDRISFWKYERWVATNVYWRNGWNELSLSRSLSLSLALRSYLTNKSQFLCFFVS